MSNTYAESLKRSLHLKKLGRTQGWKENFEAFCFADRIYCADGRILNAQTQSTAFGLSGSLSKWIDATSILDEPDTQGQRLTLLLAFAAPLIPFSGMNGVMAVPYGDNRALMSRWMLSVWGNPDELISPGGEFASSRLLRYASHCNLPILIDNDEADVSDIAKLSNEFARGSAKTMIEHEESAKMEWSSILVLPSSKPINDHIRATKTANTKFNPVFTYAMPGSCAIDVSVHDINEVVSNNYGVAGEVYAQWIARNVDWIRKAVIMYEKKLFVASRIDRKFRNLMALVACLMVAGRIVHTIKLGNLNYDTTISYAIDAIDAYKQAVEKTD